MSLHLGVAALARVALKKSDGCLLTFAALQLSSSADDAGADADHVTSEALFVGDRGAFKDLVARALIGSIERGLAVGRRGLEQLTDATRGRFFVLIGAAEGKKSERCDREKLPQNRHIGVHDTSVMDACKAQQSRW